MFLESEESLFFDNTKPLDKTSTSFFCVDKTSHYLIVLGDTLFTKDFKKLQELITHIIQNPKHVIIDCFYPQTVPSYFYNLFGLLRFQLSAFDCVLIFINCHGLIADEISKRMMSDEYPFIFENYFEGLRFLRGELPSMFFNLVKTVILAIQKTFIIQTHSLFFRRKTHFRENDHDFFLGDIQGIVEVKVNDKNVFIVLSFSKSLFLKVVSKMLMEEITEIDDENADTTAEILNISLGISRNILKRFEKDVVADFPFFVYQKDLKNVINNRTHEKYDFSKYKKLSLPFKGELGSFSVEIFTPEEYSNNELSEIILK